MVCSQPEASWSWRQKESYSYTTATCFNCKFRIKWRYMFDRSKTCFFFFFHSVVWSIGHWWALNTESSFFPPLACHCPGCPWVAVVETHPRIRPSQTSQVRSACILRLQQCTRFWWWGTLPATGVVLLTSKKKDTLDKSSQGQRIETNIIHTHTRTLGGSQKRERENSQGHEENMYTWTLGHSNLDLSCYTAADQKYCTC